MEIQVKSRSYLVIDNQAFKKGKYWRDIPTRVIWNYREIASLIEVYHSSSIGGHRGIQATFERLKQAYYWPSMHSEIVAHVRSCQPCQIYNSRREVEPACPTWSLTVWSKVHIDVVKMPTGKGNFTAFINALLIAMIFLGGL